MKDGPAREQVEHGAELEQLCERAIDGLENEAAFELEQLLSEHPQHAQAVRARIDKLARSGMLRRAGATTPQPAPVHEATLLPARAIAGRYRVLREIGRGGMGRVLLAFDERLRRDVAVKLAHDVGESPATARLKREAELLAQLEHPGIVAVYDSGRTEDGRPFYAMRIIGGRTLHELFGDPERAAQLGLAQRVQIVVAVCDAVGFAHSRGIVHRDLKPANVMLGDAGAVQVVDWGLAKRFGASESQACDERARASAHDSSELDTAEGHSFGTPSYSSPEQARGDVAEVDARSDVFGIGALLHHLLAGRPPYVGADRAEVLERARQRRMNDPHFVEAPKRPPAELAAICAKACAANKAERYATAEELAADLRAFLEQRTVKAYRTGTVAEFSSFVRRNRVGVVAAAALVLALGAGWSTYVFWRSGRDAALLSDALGVPTLTRELESLGPLDARAVTRIGERIQSIEYGLARFAERDTALATLSRRGGPTGPLAQQLELLELARPAVEAASDPTAGALAHLRRWHEIAQTVQLPDHPSQAAAWSAARDAIERSSHYSGLRIAPQVGLAPLGPDPGSGLWEFAVLATGAAPARADDGRLQLSDDSAVVLVLLPGGEFTMGAQSRDASAPRYHAKAQENEDPLVRVALDPFFLSKYELTQAQWQRLDLENPSRFAAGATYDERAFSLRHPVESVSWDECTALLSLAGLRLPTEAQWEYGARGGTETTYWTGDDEESIRGAANIADVACSRIYESPDAQFALWLDDTWALHAPVDFGRANPFGLHGVIGNVVEWCRDSYASYKVVGAPGDGDRSHEPWAGDSKQKAWRDCSYFHSGGYVRVAHRGSSPSDVRDMTIGVRPARALER